MMNFERLKSVGNNPQRLKRPIKIARRILLKLLRPYFELILSELAEVKAVSAYSNAEAKDVQAAIFRLNTIEQKYLEIISALDSGAAVVDHERVGNRSGVVRKMSVMPAENVSFSQVGEDRIVLYIFDRMGLAPELVRYIDIGAAFPDGHNNTYLFYILGASGCLVESDPKYHEMYSDARPRDRHINAAVLPSTMGSPENGTVKFYRASEPGWSTISEEHIRLAKKLGKDDDCTVSFDVPAKSIDQIFQECGFESGPDLLSIDVEGVDFDILKDIDFKAYAPKVIVCENSYVSDSNTFRPIADEFLSGVGYSRYAGTHVNSIYIRSDLLRKLEY